jgi:TetR/AcrR family transcriptional regulator, regulator of autoinduction and epiphytic fitness
VTAVGTEAEEREDGRTARSRRTRTAVVDALLALFEEGTLSPTAQQVAERAGVALRTVFGHFSDMEALWVEAGERELRVLAELADQIDPALPLAERIARFATSRSVVLERLLPVMRAARLREPTSPALRGNRALFFRAGDEEARAVFAPELAALPPDAAASLLDALHLVSAAPGWEVLRLDRGRSVEQAREHLVRHLTALLTPARLEDAP